MLSYCMRNVYCVSSRVFELRKIAFSGLIEGFTSPSRMFQNKIMTKYSAVVVFFSMSQQTRSREKSCLARRNKQQTNWETWHFSKPWTISNNTQFVWPFTSWGTLSHGFTTKSFKKLRWQSNTSKREPNVTALYGVWKVNRKRSVVKRTQDEKKK